MEKLGDWRKRLDLSEASTSLQILLDSVIELQSYRAALPPLANDERGPPLLPPPKRDMRMGPSCRRVLSRLVMKKED